MKKEVACFAPFSLSHSLCVKSEIMSVSNVLFLIINVTLVIDRKRSSVSVFVTMFAKVVSHGQVSLC